VNRALQRYLEAASGLTNLTASKAEKIVKGLVRTGEEAGDQVGDMVEELLERQKRNREAVTALVKSETTRAVRAMGLATGKQVERLQKQVVDLKRELRRVERDTGTESAAQETADASPAEPPAKEATAKKASAKKATAKKASAKKATAKKAREEGVREEGHREEGVREEGQEGHREEGHREEGRREEGRREEDDLDLPAAAGSDRTGAPRVDHRSGGEGDRSCVLVPVGEEGDREEGDREEGHREEGHREEGHAKKATGKKATAKQAAAKEATAEGRPADEQPPRGEASSPAPTDAPAPSTDAPAPSTDEPRIVSTDDGPPAETSPVLAEEVRDLTEES
jgi:polyhydroxyalkanoate synthesis regulator phasin